MKITLFYSNEIRFLAVIIFSKLNLANMEVPDCMFYLNRDWDPCYLSSIVDSDFYEFGELWNTDMDDRELVNYVDKIDKYCPIVEDISLDDRELCSAVETIEAE